MVEKLLPPKLATAIQILIVTLISLILSACGSSSSDESENEVDDVVKDSETVETPVSPLIGTWELDDLESEDGSFYAVILDNTNLLLYRTGGEFENCFDKQDATDFEYLRGGSYIRLSDDEDDDEVYNIDITLTGTNSVTYFSGYESENSTIIGTRLNVNESFFTPLCEKEIPIPIEPVVDRASPVFNPIISALPIPIDLIYDGLTGDGTFKITDTAPPITTALNLLSGASTVAPIDIRMSELIDGTSINGDPLVDGEYPNPLQNVFLIELEYASGSPLEGLTIQEPPTLVPPTGNNYEAIEIILDGTSYIRINPIKPLKPNTRYVVVVTDEVKDLNGENIAASVSYQNLTDLNEPLLSNALLPIRSIINGLWEPIAVNYFSNATNISRSVFPESEYPYLDSDNIALSYSFTTSGDEKVLNYIADPAQWFDDQFTTIIGVQAATKVVTEHLDLNLDGTVDYTDISLAVASSLAAFPAMALEPNDSSMADMFAPLESAFNLVGCQGTTYGPSYITCLSKLLVTLPSDSGGFSDLLPTPAATTMDFSSNTAPTSDLYSIITTINPSLNAGYNAAGFPGFSAPGSYQVTQGTVSLPYYSGLPTDPVLGPLALKFASWEADDTLAQSINTLFSNAFNKTIPQADPSVSSVVNYLFPFPKKQGDVTVPVIAMYPTAPSASMKTVIWGHGLKGSRTDAIPFGAGLLGAAKANGVDLTVISFDEPLHGIVGDTSAFHTENERHFEYGNSGMGLSNPPLDIDITSAFSAEVGGPQGSGSMFVNLESFATSRDNLRQNVLDLLTVRKSLVNADLDNDASTDLDATDVYYIGHSLGTISAMPFVSVANDSITQTDDIAAAIFLTPGGGISRFYENSPTFAPGLTTLLGEAGLTSGTSTYQSYFNVLQATLDSVDGVNFVDDFIAQNTPVLFVDVVDDTVIPISSNSPDRTLQLTPGELGNVYEINASVSHLSGSSPLLTVAQATTLTSTGTTLLGRSHIRYATGEADHCTPSIPGLAAFNENLFNTISIILTGKISGGPYITISNDTVLHSGALPAPLTDSFCPLSFPPSN